VKHFKRCLDKLWVSSVWFTCTRYGGNENAIYTFDTTHHLVAQVLHPLHVSWTLQVTLPIGTVLRRFVCHLDSHHQADSQMAVSVRNKYVTFRQLRFCSLWLISYSTLNCFRRRRKPLKTLHEKTHAVHQKHWQQQHHVYCSQCFTQLNHLNRQHLLKSHNEGNWLMCIICRKKFYHSNDLNDHLQRHKCMNPYPGSTCQWFLHFSLQRRACTSLIVSTGGSCIQNS